MKNLVISDKPSDKPGDSPSNKLSEKPTVNMTNSQMISLPCYRGFLEFAIWHEPQSVS